MTDKIQKWLRLDNTDSDNSMIKGDFYGLVCTDNTIHPATQSARLNHLLSQADSKTEYISVPYFSQFDGKTVQPSTLLFSLPVTEQGLLQGFKLLFDGHGVFFRAFSLSQYEKAMKLYLRAIEDRDIHFGDLKRAQSVICFDVAAIDAAVNDKLHHAEGDTSGLANRAAAALLLLARQKYDRYFSGDSWKWLADHGAQVQPILADVSGAAHPQTVVDALSDRISHFVISRNQFESATIHLPESVSETMSIHQAAQILRDLGELGIHLDEIGDMLVEQKS